jgi:uncharacterized RDD family membrane protein YckC
VSAYPDAENPYRAPLAAVVGAVPLVTPIEYASKWRRFFNWVIDAAVLYAATFAVLVGTVVAGDERWVEWYDALAWWGRYLVDGAVALAYYVVMEGVFGASVGKLVTRTRVVNESGHPPTWEQALVRTLCRFIPFEALSLAFSEDGRARGWHDSIARTYVVRRRRWLSA